MTQERAKVTIYDVAARAGVAISTVSRVLNSSADVSEMTRARVLKAIDELKYRPDRTAKKLAQQRSHTVAVALPTYTTPFHNELLKGVRSQLADREIDLLLCDLGWRNPSSTLLSFLKRGAVDALLIAGMPIDQDVAEELAAIQAPVVLIGARWPTVDSYYWNDVAGAEAAVDHLVGEGHRRIGMIRAFTESEIQSARLKGYRNALDRAGLPYDERLVVHGETAKHAGFSEEAGYEGMTQLLDVQPEVTAVFASSDVHALGAWSALRDRDMLVPRDMALVGYDDLKTSRFIGLSSVDQAIQATGRAATDRLLDRLSGKPRGTVISQQVMPELRIRRSSKR